MESEINLTSGSEKGNEQRETSCQEAAQPFPMRPTDSNIKTLKPIRNRLVFFSLIFETNADKEGCAAILQSRNVKGQNSLAFSHICKQGFSLDGVLVPVWPENTPSLKAQILWLPSPPFLISVCMSPSRSQ